MVTMLRGERAERAGRGRVEAERAAGRAERPDPTAVRSGGPSWGPGAGPDRTRAALAWRAALAGARVAEARARAAEQAARDAVAHLDALPY